MACNSCNSGNYLGSHSITFPDFVANSCCNPCCSGSVGGVSTGSCGCSCGCGCGSAGVASGSCGCNTCGWQPCCGARD